jgi:hypothetical protein
MAVLMGQDGLYEGHVETVAPRYDTFGINSSFLLVSLYFVQMYLTGDAGAMLCSAKCDQEIR